MVRIKYDDWSRKELNTLSVLKSGILQIRAFVILGNGNYLKNRTLAISSNRGYLKFRTGMNFFNYILGKKNFHVNKWFFFALL